MDSNIVHEAELCRAAFVGIEVGAIVQHCHHGEWLETLTEPAEIRIQYILSHKPEHERAERLRRFRPLANADWQKAHVYLQTAEADLRKANADLHKADADWSKANADTQKADADWCKANADLHKADADWSKANADWRKAHADWKKVSRSPKMLALHAEVCGCPWGPETDIFGPGTTK